jgi:hypothetical protein
MPKPWAYDVFVSYSHADTAWGQRLRDSLIAAAPNRRVFFDNRSLRAGDAWEDTIQGALEASKNLVLLWSDHARSSDWVQRELFGFMALAKPKKNLDRRLVCLNLQGANAATKVFQHINHAGLQGEYLKGANGEEALSGAWQQAMQEVESGLDPNLRLLEVPLVVLTLKREDLDRLEEDGRAAISRDFGLTGEALIARYGATRRDWRPFDGAATIEALMLQARVQLNASLPGRALVWRLPPDEFWIGDIRTAQDFVDSTFKPAELSVLVIDPVALQRRAVYQRLMLFQGQLDHSHTTILTLPPFATPPQICRLRSVLMTEAVPYFNRYFKASLPPNRHVAAQCGWNVSDADEMRRLILDAADEHEFSLPNEDESLVYVRQQER